MSEENINNVENFMKHRERKRHLEEMSKIDTSSLNMEQLRDLTGTLSKMVLDLTKLVEVSAMNIADLAQRQLNMQEQFLLVSGQAYLALELLKQKGICSEDEVKDAWTKILKEKIIGQQDELTTLEDSENDSLNEADLEDLPHT